MLTIYLVRHGETELNKKSVYYGWTDCKLTQNGVKHAEHVKMLIQNIKIDFVISSPLTRTLETAKIISGLNEDKIILEDRIKEMNFGIWENKHYSEIKKKYEKLWYRWCNDWKNTCIPEGESFNELYNRTVNFIEDLKNNYKNKTVLIATHQGCLRIILSYLLNLNQDGYWHFAFEHGAYSLIQLDELNHCTILSINRR